MIKVEGNSKSLSSKGTNRAPRDPKKVSTGWNQAVSRKETIDRREQRHNKNSSETKGKSKNVDDEVNSPFNLFSQLARKGPHKETGETLEFDVEAISIDEELEIAAFQEEEDEFVIDLPKSTCCEKKKSHLEENNSYINVFAQPLHLANSNHLHAEVAHAAVRKVSAMDELYMTLVQKIQEMRVNGMTETTVEVKNLSLFDGAHIVITEFDSSKGQYNISFENLSPKAQALVCHPANQDQLKQAMEQKGYTVHIIIATTEDIVRGDPLPHEPSKQGREQQEERRQSDDESER